jgi:putative transposase
VKCDWEAWNTRSLAEEPIVRLILDGTVVRLRLDRKATSISLLVVIGVRADGQKVLLAVKSMGGESAEAWRTVLDDLIKRELFWALLASGQINMRKIDGWQTITTKFIDQPIDLAA